METIIGADTSRYATGNLPVPSSILGRLRADRNVDLIIPGAWHGAMGYDGARETMMRARAMSFRTATYIALTRAGKGASDVVDAYKLLGETEWRNMSFAAIDMEYGTPGEDSSVAQMNDLLAAVDKVISLNSRPILYSAAWWWKGHFGNPLIPVGLPLWNAYYDNDPDFDFLKTPYGGPGVRVVGEQYTNSTAVTAVGATMSFDFNAFDREWVESFPLKDAGAALVALRKAWETDMADTAKGASDLLKGPISPSNLGVFGLYNVRKAQNWAKLLGDPK